MELELINNIVNELKNDYLLVKPNELKKETDSGLILTEAPKEATHVGKVIDSGPTATVKSGQKVLYPTEKNGATELSYGGETFLLIKEEVIFATLS